jgi:hypothetical protein
MEDLEVNHYVYGIYHKDTFEFYFGSRSCKGNVDKDIDYKGSMITWKPNKDQLIKKIIKSNFVSREEAILLEKELIKKNIKNPLNRNYNIPGKGFHSGFLNKTHSNETLAKISLSQNNRKPVRQYCSNTGKYIKSWTSIAQASKQLNISRSDISGVISGKLKTAGNYIWIVESKENKELNEIDINSKKYINKGSISVVQYDMNNNFIKEWNSGLEAAKTLSIDNSHITKCCKNKINSAYGFIWRYK